MKYLSIILLLVGIVVCSGCGKTYTIWEHGGSYQMNQEEALKNISGRIDDLEGDIEVKLKGYECLELIYDINNAYGYEKRWLNKCKYPITTPVTKNISNTEATQLLVDYLGLTYQEETSSTMAKFIKIPAGSIRD